MNYLASEYLIREYEREARTLAMQARLVELARCCRPSRIAALLARVRDRFSPPAPCCA
jgi:hypothetical protein